LDGAAGSTSGVSTEVFTVPYVRGYIYLEAPREADVRRRGSTFFLLLLVIIDKKF